MGCVQSMNHPYKPNKNMIANSSILNQNNSDQKQNDYSHHHINTITPNLTYSNIDQKHQLLLNQALLSALKFFQSQQVNQTKEQQKKMISSLNRYYYKQKRKGSIVESETMRQEDFQMILKTIKKHHFFKQIFQFQDKNYLKKLLLSINKKTYHYKQYIYKQFDPSSNFYIIGQGRLSLQLHSLGIKILSHSDFFGIQSIIYDSQQIQSIKVRTPKAILYQINRSQVLKIRQEISKRNKQQMKKLLQEKVIFFSFLNNKQKQKLMSQTVKCCYSKGDLIFEKDYESTSFYIIQQGAVLIKVPNKENIILTDGSFGQSAFYEYKSQRKGTAISYQNNTIVYAIGSRPIFQSLGDKLDCAVLHNLQKWAMYRDPHINDLYLTHRFEMNHLLSIFQIKKGQKYQPLGSINQPATKVFVNLTCKINYQNDITVINSKAVKYYIDKYFDEKIKEMKRQILINKFEQYKENFFKLNQLEQQWAQFNKNKQQNKQQPKYQNDIVLTAKGIYAQAPVQKVVQLVINSIQKPEEAKKVNIKVDLSIRNVKSYIVINQKTQRSTYLAIERNFGIQHILKIYHKLFKSNKKCSLKTFKSLNDQNENQSVNKTQFYQQNIREAHQHIKIISKLIHPNICGFYKAQQDNQNIYIILQYIKGITLLELQIQLGIVPEIVIKYYLLKLSLILDYLHSQKVIYRDLKPQNILIDNKGYPILFDFKTAKKLKQLNSFKTSTIIGTPHYMAPEMIQNQQYSFSLDYWQLGIILYQLIYQKYPFANDSQDPVQIFTAIVKNEPKLKKQNSNSIFHKLLEKNPLNRIKSFQQLINQKYFQNFQWEEVQTNIMKPPFIPKSTSKRFNSQPYYSNQQFQQ